MLSEPAIQVRRRCRGKQIWSLEKMENRLVDMRELYQEWQDYHLHHNDNPVSFFCVFVSEFCHMMSYNNPARSLGQRCQ